MFIILLRILLVYWIVMAIVRWLRPSGGRENQQPADMGGLRRDPANPIDMETHGKIVDADFEEFDER